jgi:hypothetical protein
MIRTQPLGLLCVLSGSLMLMSCSASAGASETTPPATPSTAVEQPQPLTMQAKEVMAEYQKAASEFPEALPAGVSFPNALPPALLKNNYVAEAGVGEGVAAHYWLCAWLDVFLDAESLGDQAAAVEASERMTTDWESLPYYEQHVEDPYKVWRKEILGPALEGNVRPLKGYFASCSFYKEHNPS